MSKLLVKNDEIKPLFSIVMNCKNGEKYLSKAIKSVKSLQEVNWELIFFDNKSNDNSLRIAKQFSNHDKRIKIFQSHQLNFILVNIVILLTHIIQLHIELVLR